MRTTKEHPILINWSTINRAMTVQQRREFNKLRGRLGDLARLIDEDLSPGGGAILPQTQRRAHLLHELINLIPWLES
jgi:hypothetical protein